MLTRIGAMNRSTKGHPHPGPLPSDGRGCQALWRRFTGRYQTRLRLLNSFEIRMVAPKKATKPALDTSVPLGMMILMTEIGNRFFLIRAGP